VAKNYSIGELEKALIDIFRVDKVVFRIKDFLDNGNQ